MQKTLKNRRFTYSFLGVLFFLATAGVIALVTGLDNITQYLSRADDEPANLIVNTEAVLGPMPRPWRNLAQGGESHDWRMGSLVPQVKALNPEYVRIDHIYTFYDVVSGTPGNLTFDFSKLDPVLDDIKAAGAKPYIALSYMPPALGGGDILAQPQNWSDWQLVVQRTIQHISGTRGFDNVYYEVWNEPDLFGKWHYGGAKNYLTLYNYSSRGAQAAANTAGVRPFKLGGPVNTALYKNWFTAMAKYVKENNLRWDFFSWHRYSDDINQYRKDMTEIRTWLQDYPDLEATLELHITEWGHDSDVNPGYDTNYGAAHTVAGAIEMVGIVERAFVFEIQDGKDPGGQEYWGRWGLFTHQDFGSKAKPRYHALRMLDRLANQRVQVQGKGSFVKALAARDNDGNTEVVISNFDERNRNSEQVPLTFDNIEPGSYAITQEFLGGRRVEQKVATTAAILQTSVTMLPNTVVFVELKKDSSTPTTASPSP